MPLVCRSRASDAHSSASRGRGQQCCAAHRARLLTRSACITWRGQHRMQVASTLHVRECSWRSDFAAGLQDGAATVAFPAHSPPFAFCVTHGAPRQRCPPSPGTGGAPDGGRRAGRPALGGSASHCRLRHPLRVSHRQAVVLREGAALVGIPAAGQESRGSCSLALTLWCLPPPCQVHGRVSTEPAVWVGATVEEGLLTEVLYEKSQGEGMAKVSSVVVSASTNQQLLTQLCCVLGAQITINRPHMRNAFTPRTGEWRGATEAGLTVTECALPPHPPLQSRRCPGAFATLETTPASAASF